jgi:hypothetical protein
MEQKNKIEEALRYEANAKEIILRQTLPCRIYCGMLSRPDFMLWRAIVQREQAFHDCFL